MKILLILVLFLNVAFSDQAYIRIIKDERVIELWFKDAQGYYLGDVFSICAMSGTLGPKRRAGDKQAPEGHYKIRRGGLNPFSKYHLSMNIGYPNAFDKSLGRTGSYIMIHGGCSSVGCFAIGDDQIETLYDVVEKSINRYGFVDVDIFPFRITEENLEAHRDSKWYWYWKSLEDLYLKVSN